MLDSIKIIKLDFLSVKNYIKQMIFSYIFVSVIILSSLPPAINIIYFILTSTFVMYPFMVAEQNGLNKFYNIIATNKRAIINARYLTAILYLLINLLLLVPINLLIYIGMKEQGSLYTIYGLILGGITLYSFVIAIQLPFCFKYGYAKAKIISMILPIAIGVGVPAIVLIGRNIGGKDIYINFIQDIINFTTNYYTEIIVGCLSISITCLIFSYLISLKVYSR